MTVQIEKHLTDQDYRGILKDLGLDTLEVQGRDHLDFPKLFVKRLDNTLVKVFKLGTEYAAMQTVVG